MQPMQPVAVMQENLGGAPPGSWRCSSCSNVNFPQRDICNGKNGACGMPRSMAEAPARAIHPMVSFGGPAGGQPQQRGPPEGSWICIECENINFPGRDSCNKKSCGKPRAEVDGGPPPAAEPQLASPKGNGKGNKGAPEGSWTCIECGNLNFPQRTTCN